MTDVNLSKLSLTSTAKFAHLLSSNRNRLDMDSTVQTMQLPTNLGWTHSMMQTYEAWPPFRNSTKGLRSLFTLVQRIKRPSLLDSLCLLRIQRQWHVQIEKSVIIGKDLELKLGFIKRQQHLTLHYSEIGPNRFNKHWRWLVCNLSLGPSALQLSNIQHGLRIKVLPKPTIPSIMFRVRVQLGARPRQALISQTKLQLLGVSQTCWCATKLLQ